MNPVFVKRLKAQECFYERTATNWIAGLDNDYKNRVESRLPVGRLVSGRYEPKIPKVAEPPKPTKLPKPPKRFKTHDKDLY